MSDQSPSDRPIYKLRFHGGPRDGESSVWPNPYYAQRDDAGHVYAADPGEASGRWDSGDDGPELVEAVSPEGVADMSGRATLAIDLHYRGQMSREKFEQLARQFPD